MFDEVRSRMEGDRVWAVYALGDLAPLRAPYCEWILRATGMGLLYREFSTPIFWAMGIVDPGFEEPELILQIREEMLAPVRARYEDVQVRPMIRMGLTGAPNGEPEGTRLCAGDLTALEALYSAGGWPDFFHASMLDTGVFFGQWEQGELAAVAGTHLVAEEESAAAIGNVFTHPAHRGRGHAGRLTAAVARTLRGMGISTIALSVAESNEAARRVYAKLGFTEHCRFYEGSARRLRL